MKAKKSSKIVFRDTIRSYPREKEENRRELKKKRRKTIRIDDGDSEAYL